MTTARREARNVVSLAILFEGGLLLLALPVGWLLGVTPFRDLEPTMVAVALGVVATLPLVAIMLLLSRSTWRPLRRIAEELDEHVLPLFRRCTALELALIALAAGVGEEALFRGVVQTGIAETLSPIWGVAVASVLFGAVHLITPMYAVLAALVGAYLGGLLVWSGNLLVAIVAHSIYDFVALGYWVARRPPPPQMASASR